MALQGHSTDGSLATWQEVAADFGDRPALLLGNGLSRHVWDSFGYPLLYDKAPLGDEPGCLSAADRRLFEVLGTRNFERVLAELAAAIQMAEALNVDAERFHDRYRSIQLALGSAVRRVHAGYHDVPAGALEAIGGVLQEQGVVFTTSYDLIVYWAMRAVNFKRVCDCFWNEATFDPGDSAPTPSQTPVYFLHGGLHLVAMDSGLTRKSVASGQSLLVQFERLLRGDEDGLPLLVTEGAARHKVQAIEENDYLAHAFHLLGKCGRPLVVFGSRLGEGDQHLVEALNRNRDRPVAVSIHAEGRDESDISAVKGALRGHLKSSRLLFFDAATHPLGLSELSRSSKKSGRRRRYLRGR